MGTGASNQVRSRSERARSDRDAVFPFSCPNIQPTGNDNKFPTSASDNVNNKREILVSNKVKTFKSPKISQKSEVRSLPSQSLHVRRHSHETDNVTRNLQMQDLHNRIKELELALAVSESHKLDLQDQVQALVERCNASAEDHSATSASISDTLQEALNSKDQKIKKLEADLKNAQIEFQKKALKYKKHIRGLTKQIFELRHEMSITQMEMKAQMLQQTSLYEDKLLVTPVSSKDSVASNFEGASDNSHTKVIVELSTQISDQEDQIACLTAQVTEKSRHIKKLEKFVKKTKQYESIAQTAPSSRNLAILDSNVISTTNRKRGTFEGFSNNTMQISAFNPATNETSDFTKSNNISNGGAHCKPDLERQSTALSDSDWSDGPSLPHIYRHSAPAQGRMKSSQSESNTGNSRTKQHEGFPK